jgi:hypothetical protein
MANTIVLSEKSGSLRLYLQMKSANLGCSLKGNPQFSAIPSEEIGSFGPFWKLQKIVCKR